MLCDAFLFKNVICVINSRMCLALECLPVFLLSLFHWERKLLEETQMGPYLPHENVFLRERKGRRKTVLGHFSLFGGLLGGGCFMVSMRWLSAQIEQSTDDWLFLWGGKEQIVRGYEKQYFRMRRVMGCYWFSRVGRLTKKQFTWGTRGHGCSGIVLNRSIFGKGDW